MVATALASGCGGAPPADSGSARPSVVATLPPLADWCRVLLADAADVHTLLRPGRSPHGYEPTPADAAHAADARIIVAWGASIDNWVTAIVPPARPEHTVIWLHEAPAAGAAGQGDHDAANPHEWLTPRLARRYIRQLATDLAADLPGHADAIRARATAYDAQLAALEARMARAATVWAGHGVVTMHAAWDGFLDACGLEELGSIHGVSGAPPSARDFARIAEALRGQAPRVVVVEPQLAPTLGDTIAEEVDARVVVLDPLGRLDESYLAMMDRNLQALEAVFGPIPSA